MKILTSFMLLLFTALPSSFAGDVHITVDDPGMRMKLEFNDDYKIFRKHGDIVIESEDDEVAITEEGDLWINGDEIRVRRSQRELLKEYYELATELLDRSEEIAKEGAKVGLKGAKLGIKAATGVFKILLPGYTAEDYEKEMEKAADKIEKKADKLEEKADKVEAIGEQLEEVHKEMRNEIDELNDLGWF